MPRRKTQWDEQRWTGKRPKSTEGYFWRKQRCPFCGASYRKDIRTPFSKPFQEVKQIIACETAAREIAGDYSSPASRGTVLGRLFEIKQEIWEEHLRLCEENALLIAYDLRILSTDEDLENLLEKANIAGKTVFDLLKEYE